MTRSLVLAAVAAVVAAAAPPAVAHDLRAKVTVHPDRVEILGWYDGDEPAEEGRVTVTDAAGATVATGALDERGLWSFPRPGAGEYRAKLTSAGHGDTVTFTVPATGTSETESERLPRAAGLAGGIAVIAVLTLAAKRLRRPRSTESTGA